MDNKAISSDLIRGHIDTIILYSLTDGKKTSQQIIDSVLNKSDNQYQLNQATLYSSLKRLESLKLISSVWNDSEDGRRKFFIITESGKNTVNSNLTDWKYSRAIIDKLIGFKGDEKTERIIEVEKIIEKPVYLEKGTEKNINVPTENVKTNVDSNGLQKIVIENDSLSSKIDYKTTNTELNFRNILYGLIKNNEKNKEVNEIPIAEDAAVKSFSETINDTGLTNGSRENTSNKIDFTDLKQKIESEGYKLNVSTKENFISTGALYINKVKLFSSLSLTVLLLLEFLIFAILFKSDLNFSAISVFCVLAIIFIFPAFSIFQYLKKPLKTSKKINKDTILYAGIIAFNLILFTIVLNLLFNVDFSDRKNLSLCLVLPVLFISDMVIYFVIKYSVSNLKGLNTKKLK